MTPHTFPYSYFGRDYGPYLGVRFYNPRKKKMSPTRMAIIDSGSNNIVIPYSIGREINLDGPESLDDFENLIGVGGNISIIKKSCIMYLIHREEGKMYGFWGQVAWKHPRELNFREKLEKMEKALSRTADREKIDREKNKIRIFTDDYESSVILGRPLLDNLEYIKFFQEGRNSFFQYKIRTSKLDKDGIKNYPDDIQKLIK